MAKTVAVVGASTNRHKYGNKAVRAFAAQGYTVFPINPRAAAVEGIPAYASVLDVPGPLDMATVYVPPEVGRGLLDEFARKGIGEVWFNPGAEDEALLKAARERGLNVISACSIIGIGEEPGQY